MADASLQCRRIKDIDNLCLQDKHNAKHAHTENVWQFTQATFELQLQPGTGSGAGSFNWELQSLVLALPCTRWTVEFAIAGAGASLEVGTAKTSWSLSCSLALTSSSSVPQLGQVRFFLMSTFLFVSHNLVAFQATPVPAVGTNNRQTQVSTYWWQLGFIVRGFITWGNHVMTIIIIIIIIRVLQAGCFGNGLASHLVWLGHHFHWHKCNCYLSIHG